MLSHEKFLAFKNGSLLYCGHSDEELPNHPHGSSYEINVVTDGKGKMYTDNIPTSVKKGDIYLSFPFDHHKSHADDGCTMHYNSVSFTVTNPHFTTEFAKIWINNISAEKRLCNNERIAFIIERILDEFTKEENEYRIDTLDNLLTLLMIELIRFLGVDTGKSHRNTELCCKIIGYIDANTRSITKLRDISNALGYHYNYLTSVFHKTTGLSLSKYFVTRKLEMAKTLLSQEGMSVSRVAKILNYSSTQSFEKSFRNHFRSLPRDCRKKNFQI